MPAPLLAVDAPVAALPRVLRAAQVDHRRRRAAGQRAAGRGEPRPAGGRARRPARRGAVLRRGGRALPRRALPALPRRPPADARRARAPVGGRAGVLRRLRLDRAARTTTLEADDLLGSLATVESAAGGTTLLFTGDRDMFQCVDDDAPCCCRPGKGEAEPIGPAEVRAALRRRADAGARLHRAARRPLRRAAGRARASARRPRASCCSEFGTLDALLAPPRSARAQRPAPARRRRDQADELRTYREIATLRHRRPAPARRPDGLRRPPRPRASAAMNAACGAPGRGLERSGAGTVSRTRTGGEHPDVRTLPQDERSQQARPTDSAVPSSGARRAARRASPRRGRARQLATRLARGTRPSAAAPVRERERGATAVRARDDARDRGPRPPAERAATSRAARRALVAEEPARPARPPARPLRRLQLGQRLLRLAVRGRPGRRSSTRSWSRPARRSACRRSTTPRTRRGRTRQPDRRHPAARGAGDRLVLRRLRGRADGALRRPAAGARRVDLDAGSGGRGRARSRRSAGRSTTCSSSSTCRASRSTASR